MFMLLEKSFEKYKRMMWSNAVVAITIYVETS